MKKRLSVFALLIVSFALLSGCALKEYRDACLADPACVERADGIQKNTETLVSTGVAMIPHPIAPVAAKPAGKVVGYAAEFIALILLGRALSKKKKLALTVGTSTDTGK